MHIGKRTPWSDEITLIRLESEQNADGYETVTEVRGCPPLFCSFENGVSQSEYYQSLKAGTAASAQAEVWSVDYEAFWPAGYSLDRLCEVNGTQYRIQRSFPQDFDTVTLILTEVIR